MWNKKSIAATIDHAVLKPFASEQDVIDACQIGLTYQVASVCVRPCDVALTAKLLKDSPVIPSVVIGFPHGSNRTETKALEAQLAIEDGAKELDMVMNIGQFVSGHDEYVQKDIEAVVAQAKPFGIKVKVILEICYLSDEQIASACKLAEAAGADYVKTSTGFGSGPATPEAIEIMINTVGKTMGVKAAGGVRSYETALGYLNQGCKRLGAASTKKLLMRRQNKMMKAIRYYAPQDVRVEQLPEPEINGNEILVRTIACAVCGTDLKAFRSGNPRMKAPITMGHEFTGEIIQLGKNSYGFELGDRIVMATSISCGECYYCQHGHPNLCMTVAPMGFTYPGGMAEYVVLPELAIRRGHVIKVTQPIPDYLAALAEPVSCTVNAAENCRVKAGDTVVVVGAGPMGILNACMAQEFGAAKVILSEINEKRLDQAGGFGISHLNNPNEESLVDFVMEETNGIGADVVIIAAPAAAPQEQALSYVRKRGTVCLFASLPKGKSNLSIDSRLIHYSELRIVGSSDSTPKQVERALEFMVNNPSKIQNMITHRLKLDDIHHSFDLMISGESLRVALEP